MTKILSVATQTILFVSKVEEYQTQQVRVLKNTQHSCTIARIQTGTHTRTHTRARARARTHARTHAHTHTRTRTHARTHAFFSYNIHLIVIYSALSLKIYHYVSAVQILKDHNTHVLIGPFDEPISLATESLNVTYLATSMVTSDYPNSTFQMIPNLGEFCQAILDLVKQYTWDDVSIFFDDRNGEAHVNAW